MAVLRGREGFKAYSRAMVELSDSEVVYDLYLLSKDHRIKLIVTRVKDKNRAEEAGIELASRLGVTWTVYNPVITEKTRRRRR